MSHDSNIWALMHWFLSALSIAALERHPILILNNYWSITFQLSDNFSPCLSATHSIVLGNASKVEIFKRRTMCSWEMGGEIYRAKQYIGA